MYAVVLKQVTFEYYDRHRVPSTKYFETVPHAMNTLLFRFLLPDFAEIMDEIQSDMPFVWPLMLTFIIICSLTMMNMLVGVLVEVVSVLSSVEKESMLVTNTAQSLRFAMRRMEKDTDSELSHAEFRHLLVQPEISSIVQQAGVDVVALL